MKNKITKIALILVLANLTIYFHTIKPHVRTTTRELPRIYSIPADIRIAELEAMVIDLEIRIKKLKKEDEIITFDPFPNWPGTQR